MENYEKKYKDLEGKIKKAYLYAQTDSTKAVLEDILPELAESEDEKIRRNIIAALKGEGYYDCDLTNECIAWLEKQKSVGEIVARCKDSWYNEGKIAGMAEGLSDDEKYQQGWHDALEKQDNKPQGKSALEAIKEEKADNANKVEPKFHEGEWVVYNYPDTIYPICKVIQIDGGVVDLASENGSSFQTPLEDLNVNYHLYTIKDAKDGDVLTVNGRPFIYCCNDDYKGNYCCIDSDGVFRTNLDFGFNGKTILPATKEQRDTLLKAMADAGWQFDFEKKELKKSEQKLTKFEDAVKDMMNDYRDAIGDNNVTIEEVKKHSAYLQSLISQNPAWSEEDEQNCSGIIDEIAVNKSEAPESDYKTYDRFIDWLKSLKDKVQFHWKPSGEQIDAFEHFVKSIGESGFAYPHNHNTKCVYSLLNDLKKL